MLWNTVWMHEGGTVRPVSGFHLFDKCLALPADCAFDGTPLQKGGKAKDCRPNLLQRRMRIDRWPEDARIVRQNAMGRARVERREHQGRREDWDIALRKCARGFEMVCLRKVIAVWHTFTHVPASTQADLHSVRWNEMIIQTLLSSLTLNSRSYWLQQPAGFSSEIAVGRFDTV